MTDVADRRERLRVVLETAQQGLVGAPSDEGASDPDGVDLIQHVLAYVQVVVELTDPQLITDAALNSIDRAATNIAADVPTALASSRAYADELITAVAALPATHDREVEQAVKEAAASFQRSASTRLSSLRDSLRGLAQELETLREATQATGAQTDAKVAADLAAIAAKLNEFDATLADHRQALDQVLTRHSTEFAQTQEQRAAEWQGELKVARDELDRVKGDAADEIEQHVAEIRRMEKESSGLVDSIGLGGTAERYGDEATEQKKVADTMRRLTVALAIGAVAMAIFAVVHQADDTSAVLAKLGVSLVFGALATYTARQSGRHRVREERARNLQLELTAFAPFIEPLDDDQKELERVIMTRKTFGQIRALPEIQDDHTYGPLGPVLDKIKRKAEAGVEP